jgi:hypothetical protein
MEKYSYWTAGKGFSYAFRVCNATGEGWTGWRGLGWASTGKWNTECEDIFIKLEKDPFPGIPELQVTEKKMCLSDIRKTTPDGERFYVPDGILTLSFDGDDAIENWLMIAEYLNRSANKGR